MSQKNNNQQNPDTTSPQPPRLINAWAIIIIVLLAGNIIFMFVIKNLNDQLDDADIALTESYVRMDDAKTAEEAAQRTVKAQQKRIKKLREDTQELPSLLPRDIKTLSEKGIKNPVAYITTDLLQHRELKPKNEMGQKAYYSREDIHLLSSRLAFVRYKIGKKKGHMILSYRVKDKDNITWNIIKTFTD